MQIQEIRLADIKIKNRAREDKGDIEGLAESIRTKGLIQPITVDEELRLIAGERRYLAHKKLDMDTIYAVIRPSGVLDSAEVELLENIARKDLTWDERAKLELKIWNLKVGEFGEYNVATNQAGWSYAKQGRLVGSSDETVRHRIELARTIDEMPDLVDGCKTEDEAWKEHTKLKLHGARLMLLEKVKEDPRIRRALDEASQHYMIGDALKELAKVPPESFQFAEVDPPYGVSLDARKSRNADGSPMQEYREWDEDHFPSMFRKVAAGTWRALQENSFAVFWYGMSWHCEVLNILRDIGFGIPDIPCIWTKGEMSGQTARPETTFGSAYEPFFLARKGQPRLHKSRGNVFNYSALVGKEHPTEKPLALMEDILFTILDPGCNILVPFLGSGVTLRAAYKLNHIGMGWDLSRTYKDYFLHKVAEDNRHVR